LPPGSRFRYAAIAACILSILLVPVLFRRPATTYSTLAEIGPIASDLAPWGVPAVDGTVRGAWTFFPYRIATVVMPDSSLLAVVSAPVPLEPGPPVNGAVYRRLGGSVYALALPGPGGGSEAALLLSRDGGGP